MVLCQSFGFTLKNIVLRVSRRKRSKIFLVGPFFLVFLTNCLSKFPRSTPSIHNLVIFCALAYLETEAHLKPREMLTSYIQNPAIDITQSNSGKFKTLCKLLHTQKPGILGILEYHPDAYS